MDRRDFLKLLSLGAGATAAGVVLPEVEPVRRWWAVPRGAPVASRSRVYDIRDLEISVNGIAFRQDRATLIIVPRIDPAPAPNVLHLQTGDDVRGALGSGWEELARQVDAERAQPIAAWDALSGERIS